MKRFDITLTANGKVFTMCAMVGVTCSADVQDFADTVFGANVEFVASAPDFGIYQKLVSKSSN